jgi:hypothetical protein
MRQQHPQRFQGGMGSKKKATSQKLGVKNKSKKGKVYCSQRLTSGTHEPEESSTFQRRQGIKKKGSSHKLGVKNNSKKGKYF